MNTILDSLQGLNITEAKGKVVLITGPSGSGKTTVMTQVGHLLGDKVAKVDTDYGWGKVNLMTGAGGEKNTISAGDCGTAILNGKHLIISCGMWFVQYLKHQITKFFPEMSFEFVLFVPKINDMSPQDSWKMTMTHPIIIDRLLADDNRPSDDEYLAIMKKVGENGLVGLTKTIASCDKVLYWDPLAPVSASSQQIIDVFADVKEFIQPKNALTVQLREVVPVDGIMYHITAGYLKNGTLPVTLADVNKPLEPKIGFVVDYEVESSTTKVPIKAGTKGSIVVFDDATGAHITLHPKNGVPAVHSKSIAFAAIADHQKLIIAIDQVQSIVICNITKRKTPDGIVIKASYTPIGRSFSHGDY